MKDKHDVVDLHWLVTVVFAAATAVRSYRMKCQCHTGQADNKIWRFVASCTVENRVWDRDLEQRFDTDECETGY